jgi:hypothetical protein
MTRLNVVKILSNIKNKFISKNLSFWQYFNLIITLIYLNDLYDYLIYVTYKFDSYSATNSMNFSFDISVEKFATNKF